MHNISKNNVSILTSTAESAIGLTIRAVVFRNPQTLIVEDLSSLKG